VLTSVSNSALAAANVPPHLDLTMLAGFCGAFVMMVTWLFRKRRRSAAVLFAISSIAFAAYTIAAENLPATMIGLLLTFDVALHWMHKSHGLRDWWWRMTAGRVADEISDQSASKPARGMGWLMSHDAVADHVDAARRAGGTFGSRN